MGDTSDASSPADLPAVAMLDAFAERTLSPVEVFDAVADRIAAWEPTIRALYAPRLDQAREEAQAAQQRWAAGTPAGPLDGVPITIKENIATRGTPIPQGTAATDLVPAEHDAPPAARVIEAGAVVLAKTTMPDYGMLSSGLSSFHPLTRNPWNPAWNPGGSSAGAAAAGAAGYGPLHLGSDIGGSVRLPAGWTGLVGFKPSLGRIPIHPPYFGRVVGPMTRTVADTALLMSVASAPDHRDHMSLPPADIDWRALDTDVRGLRVGVWTDAGSGLPVDPEVGAAVAAVAALLADAGAVVEPVAPFFTPEMLHDLDLFWRVRSWVDFAALPPDRQASVLPFIAQWCRSGAGVLGEELMRCVNRTLEIREATVGATQPFDYVVSPVAPVPTFPAEWASPTNEVDTTMHHIAFTAPLSMSEQPAVSVNCGFTAEGKPIAVQIAGRRFDDLGVLRVARWYEDARPPAATPAWPSAP